MWKMARIDPVHRVDSSLPNPVCFTVPCSGRGIKGDCFAGASATRALLIHGAGSSERGRFAAVRKALLAHGIGSTSFDCIGHGETGGLPAESSLASRTQQAEAVIDAGHCRADRLAVFGTSMGAYNAIKLLENRPVDALVLVVPGVYTPAAYALPFGAGFSAAIRKERSWAGSDAWAVLGKFSGRLLVIAAEHDNVIPAEIPERLVRAARLSSWRKLHVVPGAAHNQLFSQLAEQPAMFDEVMKMILECLDADAVRE